MARVNQFARAQGGTLRRPCALSSGYKHTYKSQHRNVDCTCNITKKNYVFKKNTKVVFLDDIEIVYTYLW